MVSLIAYFAYKSILILTSHTVRICTKTRLKTYFKLRFRLWFLSWNFYKFKSFITGITNCRPALLVFFTCFTVRIRTSSTTNFVILVRNLKKFESFITFSTTEFIFTASFTCFFITNSFLYHFFYGT